MYLKMFWECINKNYLRFFCMNHLGGEPSEKQLGNRKPLTDFVNILGSELYVILLIYPYSRRQISLQQDFLPLRKKEET